MKDTKTRTYLGVLAQRAVLGAGLIAATGAMTLTLMTATAPEAAGACADSNWCNVYTNDCINNTVCTCNYNNAGGGSWGCVANQ